MWAGRKLPRAFLAWPGDGGPRWPKTGHPRFGNRHPQGQCAALKGQPLSHSLSGPRRLPAPPSRKPRPQLGPKGPPALDHCTDLFFQQKHPHVIFEARTKANKGCATTGTMEWRLNMQGAKLRGRRDIRVVNKYIETALIIDKAMFDKRNGSTRIEVVHDSIQVANIADLYFRTLNTHVSVVYIESWQGGFLG